MIQRGLIAGAVAAAMSLWLFARVPTTAAQPASTARVSAAPLETESEAAARPWRRYPDWPKRDSTRFNTLAVLASPPPPSAPRPITAPIQGDATTGERLVADRTRGGSCLACHVMGSAGETNLPGNVGPDLSNIGQSGHDDEWLFNYVYDARVYHPDTIMPPWGTHGIFSEGEINDIVAFLKTLKAPAIFKEALDDPQRRAPPVEHRDNLDPLVNPGMWVVDRAQEVWKLVGPRGAACATCHSEPQKSFATWAASMPKWEPRLAKVLGVEEFVTRHARMTTGHDWLMESAENTALAVYLRYLANGSPIQVDIESGDARQAYERGASLNGRKLGQLNFSCLDCHSPDRGALKWIRGQWLGEQKGQLDHYPTWRTSQQSIWDIRRRFQWCQVAIWADELPPDANQYGDLELYLTAKNAGLKLNVPGIRH